MKRCATCRERKQPSEFSRHVGARDGLRSECKPCRAARMRAKRMASPERSALPLIVQRCHNPRHPKFHHYGGRGITVADEWRGSGGADLFAAHIGKRPSSKHSVDRIDNNRGYEPGNVRWATQQEQMLNTRCTVRLTAFGRTLTLREWSAETGITLRSLVWRVAAGWPPEEVVSRTKFKHLKKRVRRAA